MFHMKTKPPVDVPRHPVQTYCLPAILQSFCSRESMVMYRNYQDPRFPGRVLRGGDQCYSFQLPLDQKRQLICVHNKAKQFLSAGKKKKKKR